MPKISTPLGTNCADYSSTILKWPSMWLHENEMVATNQAYKSNKKMNKPISLETKSITVILRILCLSLQITNFCIRVATEDAENNIFFFAFLS